MFFTRIGKFISHLIFWGSLGQIIAGLYIGFTAPDMESNRMAARRYLADTSGELLDRGTTVLLLAVALGVLCEISARRAMGSE